MAKKGLDKVFIVQIVVVIAILVLVANLFYLQIVKGDSFLSKASSNTVQRVPQYPSRGLVYDRNGKLLLYNNAIYDLMATYNQVDPKMDTTLFCSILGITKDQFKVYLDKDWKRREFAKHKPFFFMRKITSDQYAVLQEHLYKFPGFFAQLRNVRGYAYKVGAPIFGYISEVSDKHIEASPRYTMGDYIGINGIESAYEHILRGEKGVKYVVKDNLGIIKGSYLEGERDTAAVSGKNLMLSIDIDLQAYAEDLMANKIGSVVAIEPKSGEILTFVSSPTFDPGKLTLARGRNKAFEEISADKNNPFFNRALQAQYPPGSVFKPILSLIALQDGIINKDRSVSCNYGYRYKSLHVGCHTHTLAYNVQEAIKHSCNAYYCQIFREIVDQYGFKYPYRGLDTLVSRLSEFNLGRPIRTDIGNSKAGLVPNSKYYDKMYPKNKGSWKSPTIISLGIGQGEYLFTPLQMANMTAAIANKGVYYTPHVLKKYLSNETIDSTFIQRNDINIDERHFDVVIDGMERVVQGGTARSAQTPGIDICGKTGTSQNPHGKDHSVFIAFAPKDKPEIAIAVFVENGGYGSTYAAPIASLVIEKYLNDTISDVRKYTENRILNAVLTEPK